MRYGGGFVESGINVIPHTPFPLQRFFCTIACLNWSGILLPHASSASYSNRTAWSSSNFHTEPRNVPFWSILGHLKSIFSQFRDRTSVNSMPCCVCANGRRLYKWSSRKAWHWFGAFRWQWGRKGKLYRNSMRLDAKYNNMQTCRKLCIVNKWSFRSSSSYGSWHSK